MTMTLIILLKRDDNAEKAQERYNKQIDVTDEKIKKAIENEKNYNKIS